MLEELIEMVKGNRQIEDWVTEEDLAWARLVIAHREAQNEAYRNRPGENYYWNGSCWVREGFEDYDDIRNADIH